MASKINKNFTYGVYILMMIVVLLVYDFYINFQTMPDVLNSEWFRWRVALVILLIFLSVIFLIIRKIHNNRLQQQEFTKKIIQAQEKEWKQIAAELHDSVGQNLTFVNNKILQIANSVNGKGKNQELMDVSKNLINTVDEIRSIMSKMYPHQLERLGFKKAVESLIGKAVSSSGIMINSEIENIGDLLTRENQINLYRIFQEAINNIIKHSGAKNVLVNLYSDTHTIYINIEDDGKGIDIVNESGSTLGYGYGIEFMKERVRIIGGKIKIDLAKEKAQKFI